MKKYFKLSIIIILIVFAQCKDDGISESMLLDNKQAPKNLAYQEIVNAREFASLRSNVPTIDTDNLMPTFEIVSVRKEDGTVLDASYMKDVSIQNPIEVELPLKPENYYFSNGVQVTTYTVVDYTNSGKITIADNNNFDIGTYYFTINVSTTHKETTFNTLFTDVFKITIGPQLVTNLLYSPLAQNLVVGQNSKTTKPFLITGNPAVTFELSSDQDKLNIDAQTGEISLKSDYTTIANDTIFPGVNVISNISGEITSFQGQSFLMLVASLTPVNLPKQTKYFFYPTLEANNKLFGYTTEIIRAGNIPTNLVWTQQAASPLANLDTSLPIIANKRAIVTNAVVGNVSTPHESDVIINSQDLSQFKLGFDLKAVFYISNVFVEYMQDGRTPTDLEIYMSTDYTGNNSTASWTRINDDISCLINANTGTPFIGTPYPGDQRGLDPDGKKNSARNADGRWVRCEFDLNPFKNEKNFTLKFKFNSYFEGTISGATGRSGRYIISDIHYKATEQ